MSKRDKRDPKLVLHIFTSGKADEPLTESSVKGTVSKTMFDCFRQAFHKASKSYNMKRIMKATPDAPTRPLPTIREWDYDVNHGVVVLEQQQDIEMMKLLVSIVPLTDNNGGVWHFKAYLCEEMPSWVQLSFMLYQKYMLEEEDAFEDAKQLLTMAAKDNNWPEVSEDEGPQWILVNTPQWGEYKDGQGKPTGRGSWLVRFRCPLVVANHIKTENGGYLKILCEKVAVKHKAEHWKGDCEPTLVFPKDQDAPTAQGAGIAAGSVQA